MDVATALTPIGDQLRREITAATYLQTDDTSVTVLDDRGGSFKGLAILDKALQHRPLIREIADGVAEGRLGEDGPREFLAHAVDLRQEWHGLFAAQDAAGVGIPTS